MSLACITLMRTVEARTCPARKTEREGRQREKWEKGKTLRVREREGVRGSERESERERERERERVRERESDRERVPVPLVRNQP